MPVFLLNESPAKRASILSIGRENSKIRDMIARHKVKSGEDSLVIKTGEREIATVRARMQALERLDAIQLALVAAETARGRAVEAQARVAGLEASIARLEGLERAVAAASATIKLLANLGQPPDLGTSIERARATDTALTRFAKIADAMGRAQATEAAVGKLADTSPILQATDGLAGAIRRMETAGTERVAAERRLAVLFKLTSAVPVLTRTAGREQVIRRLEALNADLARTEQTVASVQDLVAQPPVLEDIKPLIAAGKRLSDIARSCAEAEEQVKRADQETHDAAAAVMEELALHQNMCPLCGSQVAHEHFLKAEAA